MKEGARSCCAAAALDVAGGWRPGRAARDDRPESGCRRTHRRLYLPHEFNNRPVENGKDAYGREAAPWTINQATRPRPASAPPRSAPWLTFIGARCIRA